MKMIKREVKNKEELEKLANYHKNTEFNSKECSRQSNKSTNIKRNNHLKNDCL